MITNQTTIVSLARHVIDLENQVMGSKTPGDIVESNEARIQSIRSQLLTHPQQAAARQWVLRLDALANAKQKPRPHRPLPPTPSHPRFRAKQTQRPLPPPPQAPRQSRGRVIQHNLEQNGESLGVETVERANVLSLYIKGARDRAKHYHAHTGPALLNASQANKKGETWASSNYYRDLLAKHEQHNTKAAADYVPLLVNLRAQTYDDLYFQRSGAITDPRDGTTNLIELRKNQEYARLSQRQHVVEAQALQDLALHFQNLDKRGQLEQKLLDSPELLFSRVGLLDGLKSPKSEGAFVFNEANQMQDMEAIYQHLDGRTLLFDGTGPYVDKAGQIHLPVRSVDKSGNPRKHSLKTLYFNVSIQGNTHNAGPQQRINNEGFRQLEELIRKSPDPKLRARFWKLTLKYTSRRRLDLDFAFELSQLLLDNDSLLSINCFSGKDRTGVLAAFLTHEQLGRKLRAEGNRSPREIKRILRSQACKMFSSKSIAYRVVKDNTGFSALKVTMLRISILKGCKGLAVRVRMLFDAVKTLVCAPTTTGNGFIGVPYPRAAEAA